MQNNTFSPLIVGQNIVQLKSVDSTNNYLRNQLSKSAPLQEGTVIMAEEQFAGRGQGNNIWHSEPGQNLTFSLLLNPVFLRPENQFKLNIAISLAVIDVIRKVNDKDFKIKWPNDIYFKNQKIGGILIENVVQGSTWKSSIIGIGINVNQTSFSEELLHVNSLKNIANVDFDILDLLKSICKSIEFRYDELKAGKDQSEEYNAMLFRANEVSYYKIEGRLIEGIIRGISSNGGLKVEIDNLIRIFNMKEIAFVIE